MTRTIGKMAVIMLTMIVIAIGSFVLYTETIWINGPTDDNLKGFSEFKGVSAETNYIMNARKVIAHKIAGEDPVRTIYVYYDVDGNRHEDRTWHVYDDGAMVFEL